MTLEGTLRTRARRATSTGTVCLILALAVLAIAFLFVPNVANRVERQAYAGSQERIDADSKDRTTLTLSLILLSSGALFFAAYLFGRHATRQFDLSARFVSIADALCIADDDFSRFEKTVALLIPPDPKKGDAISLKELKAVVDIMQGKSSTKD